MLSLQDLSFDWSQPFLAYQGTSKTQGRKREKAFPFNSRVQGIEISQVGMALTVEQHEPFSKEAQWEEGSQSLQPSGSYCVIPIPILEAISRATLKLFAKK